MSGDICYACDGAKCDPISGAPCHECNGQGWIEEPEDDGLHTEECVRCLCTFLTDGLDDECPQCRAKIDPSANPPSATYERNHMTLPTEELERLRAMVNRGDQLQKKIRQLDDAGEFDDLDKDLLKHVFNLGKERALEEAERELSAMFATPSQCEQSDHE